MSRFSWMVAIIASVAALGVGAEDLISYSPDGSREHAVGRYLGDVGIGELDVELFNAVLTIRSADVLTLRDLVSIIYGVVEFGREMDDEEIAALSKVRLLWDQREASEESYRYRSGVVVGRELLHLIGGGSGTENPETVAVLDGFRRHVVRVVPRDEYEEGDDIRAGATASFDTAHTLGEGDVDWFVLQVEQDGRYTIETRPVADRPRVDTAIRVIMGDYERGDDDGGDGLYSRLGIFAERESRIWIEVRPYDDNSAGYYTLRVGDVEAGAVDEHEPNDTRRRAASVKVGQTIEAVLRSGDVDWFDIRGMRVGGRYSVEIRAEEDDVRGEFYVGEDDAGAFVVVPWRTEAFVVVSRKGPYYLKVGGSLGEYRVTIRVDERHEL